MDTYYPIASIHPNHLENQQFQYSNFICHFDGSHSKISPNSWIESDGRSSFSNSSSVSCWEDVSHVESYGVTNNQQTFDISHYWDNFSYNSYLNDAKGVDGNQSIFGRQQGIQNYSRQMTWKSWKEKQEFSENSNSKLNSFPASMTFGKSNVRFRDSTNFKKSINSSTVSGPVSLEYQLPDLVNQFSYSSQCESSPSIPMNIQDVSNQNFGKKKRKREINKVQRQAANLRERKRMDRLNNAFEQLWQKMPKQAFGQFSKNLSSQIKFSRVFILRSALCYIEYLKGLLDGDFEILPELPATPKESD